MAINQSTNISIIQSVNYFDKWAERLLHGRISTWQQKWCKK